MQPLNIVLVEPEIPQNTGNIARTCAATGSILHLVKPLGFEIDDKQLKRAGLDYWHLLDIRYYDSLDKLFELFPDAVYRYATTKAYNNYCSLDYPDGCFIVFGKETAGLPMKLIEKNRDNCIRIPMLSDARSLNLSNAVAVVCYEALRQQGFKQLKKSGGKDVLL
jgi:tRNA (cytidine/uridine-2'-O-)-methyltransferase